MFVYRAVGYSLSTVRTAKSWCCCATLRTSLYFCTVTYLYRRVHLFGSLDGSWDVVPHTAYQHLAQFLYWCVLNSTSSIPVTPIEPLKLRRAHPLASPLPILRNQSHPLLKTLSQRRIGAQRSRCDRQRS